MLTQVDRPIRVTGVSRRNRPKQDYRKARPAGGNRLYPKPHISEEDTGNRSIVEMTNSLLEVIAKRQ